MNKYRPIAVRFFVMLATAVCASGVSGQQADFEPKTPIVSEPVDAFKKPKPLTAKRWFANLQKVGRKYQKGETKAQTDLARKELIAKLTEELDGSSIKVRTKIRRVDWANGVAKVLTEPEYSTEKNKKSPISIHRSVPIELKITQAEAAAIDLGNRIEFSCELKFHSLRWGAVGAAENSQQLYTLRHEYISGGYLGTFTTSNFNCKIDGKEVVPRWQSD